ncbi:MAG: FG-GAP-like repeat, partial [Candidatus Sumerlaeota bacterium]|nr:FG-GAP-like repeat [Candidatus Sumerlaeota bacterium]
FDALQPWSSDDWLHDPDAKAALHFGDFNGDAEADVLEVNDAQMRVALSSNGVLGDAIDAGTVGFHDDPARGEGWWIFAGDVDQDGLDDLIQINEFGEAWVARSLGNGTFGPPVREAQLGFHHKPEGAWQIFVGHARK